MHSAEHCAWHIVDAQGRKTALKWVLELYEVTREMPELDKSERMISRR